MLKRWVAGCVLVLVLSVAAACHRLGAGLPLEAALLRQAQFAQEQLVGQLRFDSPPQIHVSHIHVQSRSDQLIQGLPSYDLRGHYDLELEFRDRTLTQRHQPFELYLQPQPEGTTWRLARLDSTVQPPQWRTYLLSGRDYDAAEFADLDRPETSF